MGKGSNTTTTQQNQTYAPAGAGYIQNALNTAQNAAQLPFNIPQAPVAGFSQDQSQAFQNVRNAQGQAQPYYNQASNLFNQSAQGPDISQFFNPYAGAVTSQLNNIFGQQQSQNTGNLVQSAGGVGADRVAVGQSQLANQQGLAAGQTLAGLYAPSLQAAQQQQNIEQGAAYGQSALGSASQNSALSGANALLGVGGLQQQLGQAQLNSPYQQQLAQAAFPYQQSQFLSGAVGSLAPGLGGNTYGTGSTTSPAPSLWSQILGLGSAGVGAVGASGGFGSNGWLSNAFNSNAQPNTAAINNSMNTLNNNTGGAYYGPGFARGGYANPYADGGSVDDEPIDIAAHPFIPTGKIAPIQAQQPKLDLTPHPAQSQQSSGPSAGDIMKMAMMFAKRGGAINPYAEGGGVGDDYNTAVPDERAFQAWKSQNAPHDSGADYDLRGAYLANMQRSADNGHMGDRFKKPNHPTFSDQSQYAVGDQRRRAGSWAGPEGPYQTFVPPSPMAEGGQADDNDPSPASFDQRFPYRMPDPKATEAWRKDAGDTTALAYAGDDGTGAAFPPPPGAHAKSRSAANVEGAAEDAAALPANAEATAGRGDPYATTSDAAPEKEQKFVDSPWAALMAAGLGIAGGTSPYAAVNIGQGGMKGLAALQAQKEAGQKDTTIAQAAKRLEQEAKFHEDAYNRETVGQRNAREDADRPYSQLTAAQKAQNALNERKQQLEELKPVVVGHDIYQQPIMAKRNPTTGEYEIIKPPGAINPQPQGQGSSGPTSNATPPQATPTASTTSAEVVPPRMQGMAPEQQAAIKQKEDEGGLPANAQFVSEPPVAPGSPGVFTEMSNAGASKGDIATVQAIGEGRQPFLPVGRSNPKNQYLMDKVHEAYPDVDATTFNRRQRTANFFAVGTQGGGGQNIAAMNTFAQHASNLLDLSDKLDRGQFTTLNDAKNWLAEHGYSTKGVQDMLGAYEVARTAVAGEAAKVFAGSNTALGDREHWLKIFNANTPASTMRAKMGEAVHEVEARLNSLTQQYNEGMRSNHKPQELIGKATRDAFEKLKGNPAAATSTGKGDPAARYKELTEGGMAPGAAYKKMHDEGY